jgi:antitoxin component of MazEF toxin-antitoxin module
MRLTVRRIGNSLGVIIPKDVLERWNVREGEALELGEASITPARAGLSKADLDELRLERSLQIVRRFTPREIRAKGLANLHRWKSQGSWGKVYDEWEEILRDPDDGRLYAAMLGRDERSMRLRQSIPYVGLLPQEVVREMNAKVAG